MQKPSANTDCLLVGWLCTQWCNNRGENKQSLKAYLCKGRTSSKECAARSPTSFKDDVRSVNFGHLVYYFPFYWNQVQFWDVWKLGQFDHIFCSFF